MAEAEPSSSSVLLSVLLEDNSDALSSALAANPGEILEALQLANVLEVAECQRLCGAAELEMLDHLLDVIPLSDSERWRAALSVIRDQSRANGVVQFTESMEKFLTSDGDNCNGKISRVTPPEQHTNQAEVCDDVTPPSDTGDTPQRPGHRKPPSAAVAIAPKPARKSSVRDRDSGLPRTGSHSSMEPYLVGNVLHLPASAEKRSIAWPRMFGTSSGAVEQRSHNRSVEDIPESCDSGRVSVFDDDLDQTDGSLPQRDVCYSWISIDKTLLYQRKDKSLPETTWMLECDSVTAGDIKELYGQLGTSVKLTATLQGPSASRPRALAGTEGDIVEVFDRPSDTTYLVKHTVTGHIGLVDVDHVSTTGKITFPKESSAELIKRFEMENHSVDVSVVALWEKFISSLHTGLMGPPKDASKHAAPLGSFKPIAGLRYRIMRDRTLASICYTASLLLTQCWSKMSHQMTNRADADICNSAMDFLLLGLSLLVSLANRHDFSTLRCTDEYRLFMARLNNFCLCHWRQDTANYFKERQRLLEQFSKSLPRGSGAMRDVISTLVMATNMQCVYTVFALVIIDGCVRSKSSTNTAHTQLAWRHVAESLHWREPSLRKSVFLDLFSSDLELGLYQGFSFVLPIVELCRKLFDSELMANVVGLVGEVSISPFVDYASDALSVWRLASFSRSGKVGESVRLLLEDTLFPEMDDFLPFVVSAAAYYLKAATLAHMMRGFKEASTMYDVILHTADLRREQGLQTIMQFVLDEVQREHQSLSYLNNVLAGMRSDDPMERELFAGVASLLLSGKVEVKYYAPDNVEELMDTVAGICDHLSMHQLRNYVVADNLESAIMSIHRICGSSATITAGVIKRSAKLRECRAKPSPHGSRRMSRDFSIGYSEAAVYMNQCCVVLNELCDDAACLDSNGPQMIFWLWLSSKIVTQWNAYELKEAFNPLLELASHLPDFAEVQKQHPLSIVLQAILYSKFLGSLKVSLSPPNYLALKESPTVCQLLGLCEDALTKWHEVNAGLSPKDLFEGYYQLVDNAQNVRRRLTADQYTLEECSTYLTFKENLNQLLSHLQLEAVADLTGWRDASKKLHTFKSLLHWLVAKEINGARTSCARITHLSENRQVNLCDVNSELAKTEALYYKRLDFKVDGAVAMKAHEFVASTVSRSMICRHFERYSQTRSSYGSSPPLERRVKSVHRELKTLLHPEAHFGRVGAVIGSVFKGWNEPAAAILPAIEAEMRLLQSCELLHAERNAIDHLQRICLCSCAREQGVVKGLLRFKVASNTGELHDFLVENSRRFDRDCSLATADRNSTCLYQVIKDFKPWQWDFFVRYGKHEYDDLFIFYNDAFEHHENFELKLALVNSSLEDPYQAGLVNSFKSLQPIMEQFFKGGRSLEAIIDCLRSPAIQDVNFDDAVKNLPMVSSLLKSVMESYFDTVQKYRDALLADSAFASINLEGDRLTYCCEIELDNDLTTSGTKKKKLLEMEELNELQLWLPYFYPQGECGDEESPVVNLANCLSLLSTVYETARRLQENGHFQYLHRLCGVECSPFRLRLDKVKQLLQQSELAVRQWQSKLTDLRTSCPVLHQFSDRDIGHMLQLVLDVMMGEETMTNASVLYSYVLTLRSFATVSITLTPGKVANDILMATSFSAAQNLVRIFSAPNAVKEHKTTVAHPNKQYMLAVDGCLAPHNFPTALLTAIVRQLGTVRFCRTQFLFCDSSTTESALNCFFNAVTLSPDQHFVVCQPESLSPHCQALLLTLQMKVKMRPVGCQVHFITCDKPLFDTWPDQGFLVKKLLDPLGFSELYENYHKLNRIAAFSRPNVTAVSGGAGDGKSHYIRRRRSDLVVVDIADFSDTSQFCRMLMKAYYQDECRSMHIRLGIKANLADVNRIFFELFWLGVLRAPCGEQIFGFQSHVHHPWDWYVEIPDDPELTEDGSALDLERDLPFLTTVSTEIIHHDKSMSHDADEESLEIDAEMRWVAGHLKCLFGNKQHMAGHRHERCHNDKECRLAYHLVMQDACKHWKLLNDMSASSSWVGSSSMTEAAPISKAQEMLVYRYICRKWTTTLTREFDERCKEDRVLWFDVLRHIVQEASYVCRPRLPFVLSEFRFPVLISSTLELISSQSGREMKEASEGMLEGCLPPARRRFVDTGSTGGKKEGLVKLLASTFKISEDDVRLVVRRRKFVLTEDFAFKLVLIHERRDLRQPLILEGDTGTGKTYLLKLYASLLTQAVSVHLVPLTLSWLRKVIFGENWSNMNSQGRRTFPKTAGASASTSSGEIQYPEDGDFSNFTTEDVLSIWDRLLLALPPDSARRVKVELQDVIKFWKNAYPVLKPVATTVEQYVEKVISNRESRQLLKSWLETKNKRMFYKVLVHPGLTKKSIITIVDKASQTARSTKQAVVVFFDEVNTSSCLDLFKEMFIENTIGGKKDLCSRSVFFISACNPKVTETNYFQLRRVMEEGFELTYDVLQLPKSLQLYVWKYETLVGEKELEDYTADKIRFLRGHPMLKELKLQEEFSESVLDLLSKMLFHAYQYSRIKIRPSFTSQRDVQRVFRLIPFFWKVEVFKITQDGYQSSVQALPDKVLQRCILLSVAVVFYLRLPVEPCARYNGACRADLDAYISDNVKNKELGKAPLATVLEQCIREFVNEDNFKIPSGVALTDALKENIFCIVACIQTKIPLGIIGEPGCSKTLSFHIVRDNLTGDHASQLFCRQFTSVDPFFCQCSPETTTGQIETVFENALTRQGLYLKTDSSRSPHVSGSSRPSSDDDEETTQIQRFCQATVFMDEAGLPGYEKNRSVMKVLHQYLDEPEVAFIALSNRWFDAANTNRMVTLLRSPSSASELNSLAKGVAMFAHPGDDLVQLSSEAEDLLQGICAGYESVIKRHEKFFHQRDLISLVRCLRRRKLLDKPTEAIEEALRRSIEENFGGLEQDESDWIVAEFFKKITLPLFDKAAENVPRNSSLQTLCSLRDQVAFDHQATISCHVSSSPLAPRYQLLVDELGYEQNFLDILFHIGLLKRNGDETKVFQVSSLSGNDEDFQCSNILASIKHSLEKPCTAVICYSPKLHGFLYELFNQNFRTLTVHGKECAYSSIAMKDSSFPCQVHEHFRCIVIVTREMAAAEKTPFLSRFSKFSVTLTDVVDYIAAQASKLQDLEALQHRCVSLTSHVEKRNFIGCGQDLFAGTLDMLLVSQFFNSAGAFSLGSSLSDSTTAILESLFRMIPLESFLNVCSSFAPVELYARVYFECHTDFTLQGAISRRNSRELGLRKILLITQSPQSRIQQLKGLLTSRGLSAVQVVSVSAFQHYSEAKKAVKDFIHGDGDSIVFLFNISQPLQKAAIGSMRQLIDEQCVTWRSALVGKDKTFVLLIYSLLELRMTDSVLVSFFNGWTSQHVSVLDEKQVQPLTVPEILSLTGSTHSQVPDLSSDDITARLKPSSACLVAEFCSRLTCVNTVNLASTKKHEDLPEEWRPFFKPLYRKAADSQQQAKALQLILGDLPPVFEWLGEAFHSWAHQHQNLDVLLETCRRSGVSSRRGTLVDVLHEEIDTVVKDMMQTILLALLDDFNLHNIMRLGLVKRPKELLHLLSFVPGTPVPLNCDGRLVSLRDRTALTPFFKQIWWRMEQNVASMRDTKLDMVHQAFSADPVLKDEWLFDTSDDFQQCLIADCISYVAKWPKPRENMHPNIAIGFLVKEFKSMESGPSLLAFVCCALKRKDYRLRLLSLLHGADVLYEIVGDDKYCALERALLAIADADDMVDDFAKLLVDELWTELASCLQMRPGEEFKNALCTWHLHYKYSDDHWPQSGVPRRSTQLSQLLESSISFARLKLPGKAVLLETVSMVIDCFSSNDVYLQSFLARYVKQFIVNEDWTKISYEEATLGKTIATLLRKLRTHSPYDEAVQVMLHCARWLLIGMEGRQLASMKDLRVDGGCSQTLSILNSTDLGNGCAVPLAIGAGMLEDLVDIITEQNLSPVSVAIRNTVDHALGDALIGNALFRQCTYYPAMYVPPYFPSSFAEINRVPKEVISVMNSPLAHAFFLMVFKRDGRSDRNLMLLVETAHMAGEIGTGTSFGAWTVEKCCCILLAFRLAAVTTAGFARVFNSKTDGSRMWELRFEDARHVARLFKEHKKANLWLEYFLLEASLELQWGSMLDYLTEMSKREDSHWTSQLIKPSAVISRMQCVTLMEYSSEPWTHFREVKRMYATLVKELKRSTDPISVLCKVLGRKTPPRELTASGEVAVLMAVYDQFVQTNSAADVCGVLDATNLHCSPVLYAALQILLSAPLANLGREARDVLYGAQLAEQKTVRDILISSLVSCMLAQDDSHCKTLLHAPTALVGSYLFGAFSKRSSSLSGAQSLLDYFQSEDLPHMAYEQSAVSTPLSHAALELNTIQTFAALTWHALLYCEKPATGASSNVVHLRPQNATSKPGSPSSPASLDVVVKYIYAIKSSYKRLQKADINISSLNSKLLVYNSMMHMAMAMKTPFKAFYTDMRDRVHAEQFYQNIVIDPAIQATCQITEHILTQEKEALSTDFVKIYQNQRPFVFDLAGEMWYMILQSGDRHSVLSHVFTYLAQYKAIRHVKSLIELHQHALKWFSMVFMRYEVIDQRLTIGRAIEVMRSWSGQRSQEEVRQSLYRAVDDYAVICRAFSNLPGSSHPAWLPQRHAGKCLTADSLLTDIVSTVAGGGEPSFLECIVQSVLSWQIDLVKLCAMVFSIGARSKQSAILKKVEQALSEMETGVSPEKVVADNGIGLLNLTQNDVDELVEIYCRKCKDGARWNIHVDFEVLEYQFIVRCASNVRNILWKDSCVPLSFTAEDGEQLPAGEVRDRQLTHEEQCAIAQCLCALDNVKELMYDLKRFVHDLKVSPIPNGSRVVLLKDALKWKLDNEGIEYHRLEPLGDLVDARKIEAVICMLESYWQNAESVVSKFPATLQHEMRQEDKTLVSIALSKLFEMGANDHLDELQRISVKCNLIEECLSLVYSVIPSMLQNPSKSICECIGRDATRPISDAVRALIAEFPRSILGFHSKQLLSIIASFLREKQLDKEALQARSLTLRDPCELREAPDSVLDGPQQVSPADEIRMTPIHFKVQRGPGMDVVQDIKLLAPAEASMAELLTSNVKGKVACYFVSQVMFTLQDVQMVEDFEHEDSDHALDVIVFAKA
ncbi:uncharacterized protein LOC135823909 [Sycon ciliatum]|uniref:uncharacterized protein LOC135823909 n=1 Tax=Sycon ciliatum TaxID=27933 RepID=UPI0031F6704D